MLHMYDKQRWKAVGSVTAELLETIRLRELSAMTDEQALHCIRSLKTPGTPWRENTNTSGLVEQQAIFNRRKRP